MTDFAGGKLSYDELLGQLEELQLRVTRFSGVEQKLLAAYHQLDRSAAINKRIQLFNAIAIKMRDHGAEAFTSFVAEALVEVFDVEIGLVASRMHGGSGYIVGAHGLAVETSRELVARVEGASKSDSSVGALLLTEDRLRAICPQVGLRHGAIFCQAMGKDGGQVIVFVAVSNGGAGFYEHLDTDRLDLLTAFSHQILAHFSSRRSLDEMRTNEQSLAAILGSIGQAVVASDAKGVVIKINPAAQTLFGWSEKDILGCTIYEKLNIVDEHTGIPIDLDVKKSGQISKSTRDAIFVSCSGEKIFVSVSVNAIVDRFGAFAGAVYVVSDVSERKIVERQMCESLEEKKALLKEVHHRVKNNLQVVSSMLRLESRRAPNESSRLVLLDMQSRIMSMALLHESLYQTGIFSIVDLAGYLKKVATHSFRSSRLANVDIALELRLATVYTTVDQAIPAGLIVNELVSNSLKHGFHNGSVGRILVELSFDEAAGVIGLRVSDSGVGLPPDFNLAKARSLGLQLVSDLSAQLAGKLSVGQSPGASFSVRFNQTPKSAGAILK